MRKLLDLREHKHTAKRLAHHHTSYRGLWLVLAVSGIGLFFVHQSARAAELVVTARVAAAIPSTPAVIEAPLNGTVVDSPNIVVSGTCPVIVPPIIVAIYYGSGELAGSSGCSAAGQFSANIHLVSGVNVLTPRVHTITNDEGPVGTAVSVTLAPAVSVTEPVAPVISVPQITFDSPFLVYKKNQAVEWLINIANGTPPYSLSIDWGDGTKTGLTVNEAGPVTLTHTYGKNGTHLISLSIKDNQGQLVTTSVAAITLLDSNNSIIGGLGGNPDVNGSSQKSTPVSSLTVNKAIVFSYSGTAIVVSIFWFGAHRQNQTLLLAGKKRLKK